ncbi:hypothetical protein JEQ12_008050 [Ovis aries]|uniref:Sphingolipid delta4-desaturase N-terminal domain-containing protein n=1 Tax=Ovis aries TaxID=9940 RepID=A0A835ZPJ2_SHEEP|nr:hypothetical protein JEQ12_008050 [Ovis aries]
MGNSAGRSDFEWVYTDQPHTQRRKEMLGERGPQVGTALGPCGVPGQPEPGEASLLRGPDAQQAFPDLCFEGGGSTPRPAASPAQGPQLRSETPFASLPLSRDWGPEDPSPDPVLESHFYLHGHPSCGLTHPAGSISLSEGPRMYGSFSHDKGFKDSHLQSSFCSVPPSRLCSRLPDTGCTEWLMQGSALLLLGFQGLETPGWVCGSVVFSCEDSMHTWPQVEKAGRCSLAHRAACRDADTLDYRLTSPVCIMGTVILSGRVGPEKRLSPVQSLARDSWAGSSSRGPFLSFFDLCTDDGQAQWCSGLGGCGLFSQVKASLGPDRLPPSAHGPKGQKWDVFTQDLLALFDRRGTGGSPFKVTALASERHRSGLFVGLDP